MICRIDGCDKVLRCGSQLSVLPEDEGIRTSRPNTRESLGLTGKYKLLQTRHIASVKGRLKIQNRKI